MCKGTAKVTAVGGNQAPDEGALAVYGIRPDPGTVAVDPAQFGIPYGGSTAQNTAGQAELATLSNVRVFSPEITDRMAQFNGPAVSSLTISDVINRGSRGGSMLRLDVYRMPTLEDAINFGSQNADVLITNYPMNRPCPFGTTEVGNGN